MNVSITQSIEELKTDYNSIKVYLDINAQIEKMQLLEEQMAEADFWQKQEGERQKVIDQLKEAKQIVTPAIAMEEKLADIEALYELAEEEQDEEVLKEIEEDLNKCKKKMKSLRLSSIFSNPEDKNNVFLSVQAGVGGTDACDWANMLLRMYLRFANNKDFSHQIVEIDPEEEAGIKSVTIHIKGVFAYGYLKSETGIHRLVRISPFNANGKRQTSFASVMVTPEFETPPPIEIDEKRDLKIDTYRASGAGGQHVNVTDSAVRITHLPTGMVVSCQNERSQHKNKATAFKILQARIYQKQMDEQREAFDEQYGQKKIAGWSNQIRSYCLHPYTLVKDHRTSVEKGNAQGVLDGDLDDFIEGYLLQS
ncbi:peptide chain release factor 2 [Candidatus Uabimicrobium sp. HlEnr_7]|uniref:peptide chain release factor 2 n=1 Tax=Candidatus Uabimicrobium helgolandensis TaxID=3095367 RepID=UPI0035562D38